MTKTDTDARGVKAAIIVAKAIGLADVLEPIDPSLPLESGVQMPASAAYEVFDGVEYGSVYDALTKTLHSMPMYLDIVGLPDYHDYIVEGNQ